METRSEIEAIERIALLRLIPPALLYSREALTGVGILEEFGEALGTLLWVTYRDVELWGTAGESGREGLFHPASKAVRLAWVQAHASEPELVRHLTKAASVLGAVDDKAGEYASRACIALSEWADERGKLRTAAALAQAAALASPYDASAAFRVGLIARKLADYGRAESWFRRSLVVARRTKDWRTYARTYSGIGNLHVQRGAWPAARKAFARSLHAARRYRVWGVRAEALHDLFTVEATAGNFARANALARAALRAYGRNSRRLPALAHDVAYAWMLQGHFKSAVPVLRALVRRTTDRPLRLLYLSTLARAASVDGQEEVFTRAWGEAWALIEDQSGGERVPEALINLARGAAHIGDVERACIAAHFALSVALVRKEAQAQLEAESILGSISRTELNEVAEPAAAAPDSAPDAELISRLVEVLSCGGD